MDYCAIDTETTGLDTENDRAFCISYCTQKGEKGAIFEPFNDHKALLYRLLYQHTPVFFNAKFDIKMLENADVRVPDFEDVLLLSHLLDEYLPKHSLEYQSRRFLSTEKYNDPEFPKWCRANKKDVQENGYLNVPRELLGPYAVDDAVTTIKLWAYYRKGIEDVYDSYQFEKNFLRYLIKLERTGMQIDVKYGLEKAGEIVKYEAELREYLETEFGIKNPNSNVQIQKAFADNGYILSSTGASKLQILALQGSTLAKKVLEYRRCAKTRGTYIFSLLQKTHPQTHRLHADFNQSSTRTSRLSSSRPNFQNITKPGEAPFSEVPRGMFIASPGYYLIGADYDQQEIRIIGDESEDPTLLKMLRKGGDVYIEIAKLMWPSQEIDKRLRFIAKQTTLGVAYWMGAPRFVEQASGYGHLISLPKARDIIDYFGERFPRIISKRLQLYDEIISTGSIVDRFGQHYHVPKKLAYKALNNQTQGTAAGIIKRALLAIDAAAISQKMPIRIVNTIHDEIIAEARFDVPREEADQFLRYFMQDSVQDYFNVPMTASSKMHGSRWGETLVCES